ncbi:MAG: hypothetical protein ACNA8N_06410 [Trueperaceae bacterium]
MRTFEWLLLALVAGRILSMLVRGEAGAAWRGLFAVAAGGAWVAHLAFEGPRWSMVPTYLAVVAAVLLLPWERPHAKAVWGRRGANRRRRRPRPWGRALLWAVLWFPAAAVPILLPVPVLPAPTGPWGVGTVSFALALPDATLPDGTVETGRRSMARLWYPVAADPPPAADAPWAERADVVLPAMAARGGLPAFAFGHLALVRTHATWLAELAPAPEASGWPLVVFDHGLGGFRQQNTFLVEELASHGAVVAAIDHPGDALGTSLPDGATLPYVGLPAADTPGYADAVAAMGSRWRADTLTLLRVLRDLLPVGDLAAFAGALDLERVVAAGHSTGGGVAVEVCHAWDGCVAVLALDPWWGPVDPELREAGSDRPLVVVDSDPALGYFAPANGDRLARFVEASAAPVLAFVLEGAGHQDLNDTMHLAPSWLALRLGYSIGPVDKDEAMAAVRGVARAWVAAAAAGRVADGLAAVEAVAAAPLRLELAPAAR